MAKINQHTLPMKPTITLLLLVKRVLPEEAESWTTQPRMTCRNCLYIFNFPASCPWLHWPLFFSCKALFGINKSLAKMAPVIIKRHMHTATAAWYCVMNSGKKIKKLHHELIVMNSPGNQSDLIICYEDNYWQVDVCDKMSLKKVKMH